MKWLLLENNIATTDWGWVDISSKYILKTTDHHKYYWL